MLPAPTLPTSAEATSRASGRYAYWLNGAPAGVVETWTVHRAGPEALHLWAERDAAAFGNRLTVAATAHGARLTDFRVTWDSVAPNTPRHATAVYHLTDNTITIERNLAGVTARDHIPAPPGLVISPLLRLFQGPAIRHVAERGQGRPVPVLVPWIGDPADAGRWLTPQLDQRWAIELGTTTLTVDGAEVEAARYRYVGGQYDASAEFLVRADGLLLRYHWRSGPAQAWEVRAEDLSLHALPAF